MCILQNHFSDKQKSICFLFMIKNDRFLSKLFQEALFVVLLYICIEEQTIDQSTLYKHKAQNIYENIILKILSILSQDICRPGEDKRSRLHLLYIVDMERIIEVGCICYIVNLERIKRVGCICYKVVLERIKGVGYICYIVNLERIKGVGCICYKVDMERIKGVGYICYIVVLERIIEIGYICYLVVLER